VSVPLPSPPANAGIPIAQTNTPSRWRPRQQGLKVAEAIACWPLLSCSIGPTTKVSDGSQQPAASTSPLGVPAGARSLDRPGSIESEVLLEAPHTQAGHGHRPSPSLALSGSWSFLVGRACRNAQGRSEAEGNLGGLGQGIERQGQRREPATRDSRIATRRAGWLPFAGPPWFD